MMLVDNCRFEHKVLFQDPAQLALALGPIAGNFVRNSVLLLMIDAAVLSTTAISRANASAYGEVQGWEHSLHKKLWEAPGFYGTYIACVGAAAAVVHSACAVLVSHYQHRGVRMFDSAFRLHLSTAPAERPENCWGNVGLTATGQLHQLDDHRRPIRPVAAARSAGNPSQSLYEIRTTKWRL